MITDQTIPKLSVLNCWGTYWNYGLKCRLLSAPHSSKISEEKALESGMDEFRLKPINRQLLAEKVRKLLDAIKGEIMKHSSRGWSFLQSCLIQRQESRADADWRKLS